MKPAAGWAPLVNDSANGVMLVGSFEDRVAIGDSLVAADSTKIFVTAVE